MMCHVRRRKSRNSGVKYKNAFCVNSPIQLFLHIELGYEKIFNLLTFLEIIAHLQGLRFECEYMENSSH